MTINTGDRVRVVKAYEPGDWLRVGDLCTVTEGQSRYDDNIVVHIDRTDQVGGFEPFYFEKINELTEMDDAQVAAEYRRIDAQLHEVFEELRARGFHIEDDGGEIEECVDYRIVKKITL